MRSIAWFVVLILGCDNHRPRNRPDASGNGHADACVGLQCQVANCAQMGLPKTTVSGTVFAPNGTLPLYGVNVYVPNADPGPIIDGVSCSKCSDGLPGAPVTLAVTDEAGMFSLSGVPSGTNIPVVITIGKWRRQLVLPSVSPCTDNPVSAADTTLPRSGDDMSPNTAVDAANKPKVDMPVIAISTGSADSLECLVRRLGIADKEITTDAQGGHVQLFADTMSGAGLGVASFSPGFAGGTGSFADSQTLWGNATDPGKLSKYDIVILSCEGAQHGETKPQQALDHLKAYADQGGRVFLSHWHNIWVEGDTVDGTGQAPPVWPSIASWTLTGLDTPTTDTIDEVANPKGMSFATWMIDVGGSPVAMRDAIPLQANTGRQTCSTVDAQKAEQWVYFDTGAQRFTQNFQFTTPNEQPADQRCGKVVFSDMHVSGDPQNVVQGYPMTCGSTNTLSSQEKALAFMFFDISSCVGQIQ